MRSHQPLSYQFATLRYSLFFLFCLLMIPSFLPAQKQEDNNVVIASKKQEFSFSTGKGDAPVLITEKYSERYRCKEVRSKVLFSEMYNENEAIEDVEIRVDDKKAKWITPVYDYYSVKNIFYSDAHICYFELPVSGEGGYSEVTLTKTYKDPRYFSTVYFSEDFFVENKTISFTIPRWMNAEIREFNFNGYDITKSKLFDEKQNADIITYTAKNIPAYKKEAYAPGPSYILPHLLVMCKEADVNGAKKVYFRTLSDQYSWYHELVQKIGDDQDKVREKAKELTDGLTDDFSKIKRVYSWVQQNIRYIAFEDGIAGFKPAKAMDVLNKKYGDCKGMANLTKGLLQSLGYDARLCWIGTNHIAYDYSTPSMAVDNHMICALLLKGKKYFLDATETNIGFNEYAERIQGRQVLIEDGEKYLLDRVPLAAPGQNRQTEKAEFSFDGTENIRGTVNISYKGESREDLLNKIEATKKDNLLSSLTDYLAEDNRKYEISNLKTGDILSADTVLHIGYDVDYKGGASSFGNEIYFEMDFRKEWDGFIIDTAKRTYDILLPYKTDGETVYSVKLPPGYKVKQLPAGKKWELPGVFISVNFEKTGDGITYTKKIRISDTRIKKEYFSQWNRVMTELSKSYREQIVLEKQ